jgi:uncharacterized membrane protein YidH (DUF202 family)
MTITIACSWASGLWMANIRRRAGRNEKTVKQQTKAVMIINIALNLLILGFFKYYNFFHTKFCGSILFAG